MIRIGVNALYLIPGGVGGTEIYLRCLLAALAEVDSANQYVVFTNRETGGDLAPDAPNFQIAPQNVRAESRPARILWEQNALPFAAMRAGLDVLWNPGFTAPLACGIPQVTTFHDLQHKRHPEHFRAWELPFWRFFLYWSARVSRKVVAVSQETASDLRHYYQLPDSKLRVVPSGVNPAFFDVARRLRPEPVLLVVSTLHPHKNLDGLLRAFALFRMQRNDFRLVVVGMHGLAAAEAHKLRDRLGLTGAVDFPGWVPQDELYDWFARAWAFLYPSKFEGFGLPVLEALAAGVPTACSAIEPLASMAGDAAVQFDPSDPKPIAAAMRQVVEDEELRARLAEAGPRRAAEFGWRKTASAMVRVFEEAR